MNTPAIHKYNSEICPDTHMLTEGYKEIEEVLSQEFSKYDLAELMFARSRVENVLVKLINEKVEQLLKDEGLDCDLHQVRFDDLEPYGVGRLTVEEGRYLAFNRYKKDGQIRKRGVFAVTLYNSTARTLYMIKRKYQPYPGSVKGGNKK